MYDQTTSWLTFDYISVFNWGANQASANILLPWNSSYNFDYFYYAGNSSFNNIYDKINASLLTTNISYTDWLHTISPIRHAISYVSEWVWNQRLYTYYSNYMSDIVSGSATRHALLPGKTIAQTSNDICWSHVYQGATWFCATYYDQLHCFGVLSSGTAYNIRNELEILTSVSSLQNWVDIDLRYLWGSHPEFI